MSTEWISVEERLPEDGITVLVCNQWGGIYTCRLPVIQIRNSIADTDVTKQERFTHWMPLPTPPKEAGE